MATFLIALFSVVLVLVCLFVTLLVLMQKPSANSGMGAALGGGAAEQAFGGEATNVLTRGTIYAIIAFFILSFGLYLGTLAASKPHAAPSEGASISKLGESAATEPAGTPEPGSEAASAVAGEEVDVDVEEEAINDEAADLVEEMETSVNDVQDAATEETKKPLQLQDLDEGSANNGS